jgi:hypothetical protein
MDMDGAAMNVMQQWLAVAPARWLAQCATCEDERYLVNADNVLIAQCVLAFEELGDQVP